MCLISDPGTLGAGAKTRLHTPKAVTYHEQPHYCRFMIGHSLGRMESRIKTFTPHCVCRPNAQVEIFGSVRSEIYLPTSDIDMVVLGEWQHLPINTLAKKLRDANITSKMQVIGKARVPIIKLRDAISSTKPLSPHYAQGCDLSCTVSHYCRFVIGHSLGRMDISHFLTTFPFI